MRLQMMQTEHRNAARVRECTGECGTDEQCPGETGTFGICNEADVVHADAGIGQGLADQREDMADMIARGELGHDTAVACVQRDLAVQPVGEQPARARIDGNARLVAGRLDAENAKIGGIVVHIRLKAAHPLL